MSDERDMKIDYIEFPAADITETRSFYESVFGWEFEDYGPAYTSFRDGRLSGGFDASRTRAKGGPLVVLYAEDLEGCRDEIVDAGGSISREIFEFPGGRRFHFVDPSGNELAVWCE